MTSRPKKPSSIFVGTDQWWLNATLDYMHGSAIEAYATGYLEVAGLVSRHLARGRRGQLTLDTAIFPLVYLWRHYFELRMKELNLSLSALFDEEPPKQNTQHDLGTLWGWLRPMLLRYNAPAKELRLASTVFKEFARVDYTSQTFRYQEDVKGNRTAQGITHINVAHFTSPMKKLARFLEGVSMAVSVDLQCKADMESYYGP
jgi:hypothetical protein